MTKLRRNFPTQLNLPMTACGWNLTELSMRARWILPILGAVPLAAAEPGSTVIVVYNSAIPESKQVAEYYAEKRQVPKNQVFGFALSKDPKDESMTRSEFINDLQKPLLKQLEANGLFKLAAAPVGSNTAP